ncbi:E3 ubiquitin-protein ligase TRIM35-like [Ictalurus furcatus]|uniref:E3 ubiquitin-protein ligase TRIM35-like n=1 Tax=Ictalurus furcatus TaxID=66913 RepID=UPI0023508ED6|nr:E3 ubiquitin-protein ligase TRIM35-like [Ictalurus furcatus]
MASYLEEDLSCPVCLEIYKDPQFLSCGHTFCRRCLGYQQNVFSAFSTRTCPVCQREIHQEPVSNLALRKTCESYQRERKKEKEKGNEEREEDSGIKCLMHGEKLLFFCRDHEVAICSQCRKQSHMSHSVQPLTHTVRQRKDQIKAALRPAEKVLECLRNGTALERKVTKYIESQAEQTEKHMKEEFDKLHQFLREEEEARRAALREEEKEKKGKLEGWIEQELQSLFDKLIEVEEEMENDDVTFLANYDHIMTRARYRPSDSQLNSGSLIDVAKHVGNLRFRVWEKMKDLCPYYPVVLDPNSSLISVSDDLVCVSRSIRRFYSPSPLQNKDIHLVLGSEAQNASFNCWDVEVGDSKHWTLGVCRRWAAERNRTQPLTPQNGFWGLSRNGDFYNALWSAEAPFRLRRPPKTVRVKLYHRLNLNNDQLYWMLRFLDARNESAIACIRDVAFGKDLFPFLIPEERDAPLCIVPVNINMTTEKKFSFFERHVDMIPLYVIAFLVVLLMLLVMIWTKIN